MATEKRLIGANDAMQFLREQKVNETGAFSKGINKGLHIAISALGNDEIIPTVDVVEVVHGRWNTKWLLGHEYAECSRCGCSMIDTNKFWGSNYCPNCGAKMDGERRIDG